MTYLEIYQIAKRLVPAELREKYDHLAYGELADVAELPQGRSARAVAASPCSSSSALPRRPWTI